MSDTPETQKAVLESNGQWSFVLKECCERLERERDEAREDTHDLTEGFCSELLALVTNWQQIAQRKFTDAEQVSGMEKNFIEHGAMCYFNAARELNEVLTLNKSSS